MNTMLYKRAFLAASLSMFGLSAQAAYRDEFHHRDWVLDGRYNHNHYYPPAGYTMRALPRGAVTLRYQGAPYFFHEGVWYRPGRGGYTVIAAPLGAFLPVLPPFYSTVWFAGRPHYYADSVYYVEDPARHGYVVSAPPQNAGDNAGDAAPGNANQTLFIYPKNGQSSEQQATDRYECYRWASDQAGFDPTKSQGGVSAGAAAEKRADYHRAEVACLEARNYSVK